MTSPAQTTHNTWWNTVYALYCYGTQLNDFCDRMNTGRHQSVLDELVSINKHLEYRGYETELDVLAYTLRKQFGWSLLFEKQPGQHCFLIQSPSMSSLMNLSSSHHMEHPKDAHCDIEESLLEFATAAAEADRMAPNSLFRALRIGLEEDYVPFLAMMCWCFQKQASCPNMNLHVGRFMSLISKAEWVRDCIADYIYYACETLVQRFHRGCSISRRLMKAEFDENADPDHWPLLVSIPCTELYPYTLWNLNEVEEDILRYQLVLEHKKREAAELEAKEEADLYEASQARKIPKREEVPESYLRSEASNPSSTAKIINIRDKIGQVESDLARMYTALELLERQRKKEEEGTAGNGRRTTEQRGDQLDPSISRFLPADDPVAHTNVAKWLKEHHITFSILCEAASSEKSWSEMLSQTKVSYGLRRTLNNWKTAYDLR